MEMVVELLGSLMIAALSCMLQEWMRAEMILRRYFLWLLYHWKRNWRKKDRWKRKAMMLQPLGLCIYCNSTWLGIAYYLYKEGPKVEVLLFLGMVFVWCKIFVKKGFLK